MSVVVKDFFFVYMLPVSWGNRQTMSHLQHAQNRDTILASTASIRRQSAPYMYRKLTAQLTFVTPVFRDTYSI
jgi:hypothetical protein